jgi:predicted RNA binding protein YcfA (HicA-like mRNA interferase family)
MSQRLPAVSARQVLTALRKGGFIVDRVVGSHYILARPDDPTRAMTVPVHGARTL